MATHEPSATNSLPLSHGPQAAAPATSGRAEIVTKLGTLLSAVMASSCCWLPLLLLAFGVSGAGIASTLQAYRPVFLLVTFGFLAAAFYVTYRPRHATGRRAGDGQQPAHADGCAPPLTQGDCCAPQTAARDCCAPPTATAESCCSSPAKGGRGRINMMSLNKAMLWVVTALAVVFLLFPHYVGRLLGTTSDAVTADMQRTVVAIEGMDCEGCAPPIVLALRKLPGVLAVEVDYPAARAIVGTEQGRSVPRAEIQAALKSLGFRGEFVAE
jgi:copper chaperone CopZ